MQRYAGWPFGNERADGPEVCRGAVIDAGDPRTPAPPQAGFYKLGSLQDWRGSPTALGRLIRCRDRAGRRGYVYRARSFHALLSDTIVGENGSRKQRRSMARALARRDIAAAAGQSNIVAISRYDSSSNSRNRITSTEAGAVCRSSSGHSNHDQPVPHLLRNRSVQSAA
jgi:hypothetical protein